MYTEWSYFLYPRVILVNEVPKMSLQEAKIEIIQRGAHLTNTDEDIICSPIYNLKGNKWPREQGLRDKFASKKVNTMDRKSLDEETGNVISNARDDDEICDNKLYSLKNNSPKSNKRDKNSVNKTQDWRRMNFSQELKGEPDRRDSSEGTDDSS